LHETRLDGLFLYQLMRFETPLFIHRTECSHQFHFTRNNIGGIAALERSNGQYARINKGLLLRGNDLLQTDNKVATQLK